MMIDEKKVRLQSFRLGKGRALQKHQLNWRFLSLSSFLFLFSFSLSLSLFLCISVSVSVSVCVGRERKGEKRRGQRRQKERENRREKTGIALHVFYYGTDSDISLVQESDK